jgi:hypothetical protein
MDWRIRTRVEIGGSLAALLAAAALSGCGSSGASSTASTTSSRADVGTTAREPSTAIQTAAKSGVLTRAELALKAASICKRVDAEVNAVKAKNVSVAEIVRIVPARAASERKAAIELSKLAPPASLTHGWRRIVAYRRTLANELAELVRAARKNEAARIKVLSASKLRERRLLLTAAKRTGLTECGTVG